MNPLSRPVTYRMLHEHCAGMGLEEAFFNLNKIDPNAPVACNCKWDAGHEPHCDIVLANEIRSKVTKEIA